MEQQNTPAPAAPVQSTPVAPVQGNKKSNGALIGIIIGVAALLIIGLVVLLVVRGGSDDSNNSSSSSNNSSSSSKTATADPKADNDAYFIKIDGKTFGINSKISDLESVGYKVREAAKDSKVPAKKYLLLIGGSKLTNESNKASFDFTSYNDSDEDVVVTDAKLGRVSVSYGINEDDRKSIYEGFEFYGGIHLGSTEEDVKAAFGEPTGSTDYTDYKGNPYTKIEYQDAVFRKFVFSITDGKVTEIEWTNYGTLVR